MNSGDDFDGGDEALVELSNLLVSGMIASGMCDEDGGWYVEPILTAKVDIDGKVDGWDSTVLDEILLRSFPAKVPCETWEYDRITDVAAALMLQLGVVGIVDAEEAAELAERARRLRPRFVAEMSNPDNWGFGKRLWTTGEAEGFDLTDQASLDEFMNSFNDRTLEERDSILGALPSPSPQDLDLVHALGPMPAARLAPVEELEATAAALPMLERMRRLLEYVGEAMKLTDKDNIKLADARKLVDVLETGDGFDPVHGDKIFKTRSSRELPELDLTFELALASGLLEVERHRAVRGPNSEVLGDPLDAAYGFFIAFMMSIGPLQFHWRNGDTYGFGWFAEDVDRSLPAMLIETYMSGPLDIDKLVDDVWADLMDIFDFDDVPAKKREFHRDGMEIEYRFVLDRFVAFGVVSIDGETKTPDEYGGVDRSGGVLGLTDLGTYLVNRTVSTFMDAPVVGTHTGGDAAGLLKAAADMAEPNALAEVEAWIASREDGVTQLVEAMAGADETGRSLAYHALVRRGPDGVPPDAFAGHPDLWPYGRMLRVDLLVASPEEMDVADNADMFVSIMSAVVSTWGAEAAVHGWVNGLAATLGPVAMMNMVWRVDRPETEDVLNAIGELREDKALAKAARKALFKYRSA